jgi:hypothetical protein
MNIEICSDDKNFLNTDVKYEELKLKIFILEEKINKLEKEIVFLKSDFYDYNK